MTVEEYNKMMRERLGVGAAGSSSAAPSSGSSGKFLTPDEYNRRMMNGGALPSTGDADWQDVSKQSAYYQNLIDQRERDAEQNTRNTSSMPPEGYTSDRERGGGGRSIGYSPVTSSAEINPTAEDQERATNRAERMRIAEPEPSETVKVGTEAARNQQYAQAAVDWAEEQEANRRKAVAGVDYLGGYDKEQTNPEEEEAQRDLAARRATLQRSKWASELEYLESTAANDPMMSSYAASGSYTGYGNDVSQRLDPRYVSVDRPDTRSGVTPTTETDTFRDATEDEKNTYNYWLGKEKRGEAAAGTADRYLNLIQERLNERAAQRTYNEKGYGDLNTVGQIALKGVAGLSSGVADIGEAAMGIFLPNRVPSNSSTAYLSAYLKEDLHHKGVVPEVVGDLAETTGRMLPSIGAGLLTSGIGTLAGASAGAVSLASSIASNAVMGAGVYGQAYNEMRRQGYSNVESNLYASLNTASELFLEKLINGVAAKGVGTLTGKAIEDITKGVDSAVGRFFLTYGAEMLSEGVEEFTQDALDPLAKYIATFGDDLENVDWEQAAYSFLLGSLNAGVLNGASIVTGKAVNRGISLAQARELQKTQGGAAKAIETGQTYSADSVAYQIAQKLAAQGKVDANGDIKVSAWNLARLIEAEGAELTDQLTNDITNQLILKGYAPQDAQDTAEMLAAAVIAGDEFSESQRAILEKDETISNVFADIIAGRNTTVNQRVEAYNQVVRYATARSAAPAVTETDKEKPAYTPKLTEEEEKAKLNKGVNARVELLHTLKDKAGDRTYGNLRVTPETEMQERIRKAQSAEQSDTRIVSNRTVREALADKSKNGINLGIDEKTQNAVAIIMEDAVRNGFVSEEDAPIAAVEAVQYSVSGIEPSQWSDKVFASVLPDTVKSAIYNVANKATNTGRVIKSGKYTVSRPANYSSLSRIQRASIDAVGTLVEAGVVQADVRFFQSTKNDAGNMVLAEDVPGVGKKGARAPNGQYDAKTNTVWLDVNAGNNGEGVIMYTLWHEIAHQIAAANPELFGKMVKAVSEVAMENGIDVVSLTRQKMENDNLDYTAAAQDVVCDAMSRMFTEREENIRKLAEAVDRQDHGLYLKMKDFFRNVAKKLRAMYNSLKQGRQTAYSKQLDDLAKLAARSDRIADLWVAGVTDRTGVKENAAAADTETENAKRSEREDIDKIDQLYTSEHTSRNQIPALMKDPRVVYGDVNIDVGGGKYDKATEYLRDRGVTNYIFDPFNRDEQTNRRALDIIMNGGADTATCANVLNVISEPSARANVILEAAKAIKPGGTAYFSVYEGDGTGRGRVTVTEGEKSWQEHRKTETYLDEIRQYFNNVVRKGQLIIATEPKADLQKAYWQLTKNGPVVRYSLRDLTPEEEKNRDYNDSLEFGGVPKTLNGTPIKRYKGIVGKEVSGKVYLHKDYAEEVIPADIYEAAQGILERDYPGFDYNCVMYDRKTGRVRFDEAPDFDTAREPIAGNYVTVDPANGTSKKGYSDFIWHHKWLWVKDDYEGFDVPASWEWSRRWLSVLRDTGDKVANGGIANGSGHGTANWDKQLRYFGLPTEAEANAPAEAEVIPAEKSAVEAVGVEIDEKTGSANPVQYSLRTWETSDYMKNLEEAAAELAKATGVSKDEAKQYIIDVNNIAKIIASDRQRYDYESAEGSPFVSNVEYGGSIDFSTICKKRLTYTGTLEAIQNAMPDHVLTAGEMLNIRAMMMDKGYEVACGLCYVEGSRVKVGEYAAKFLDTLKESGAKYIPDMSEVNTIAGLDKLRKTHPEIFKQYTDFMNRLAQRKPKMFMRSTEYTREILDMFLGKPDEVEEKNKKGGLRIQSFSDFLIVHLLDSMQVITDMARVGLAGQAYTKVGDFARALGNTGLKINLSLIAKDVDENGKLVYDEVNGMKRAEAEELRNAYSKNVGTIIVVFTDEQLKAAMADPFIDYIIPFHRSQWNKKQYAMLGLPEGTKDYTLKQNERYAEPVLSASGKKLRPENRMPNDYWDFSKSGKYNAEAYLRWCAENNRIPKFKHLLVKNADGSYSLQPDGSTDGYWKLLIDFKMYDNEGNGSPQLPVKPVFNMAECERMLAEYHGDHRHFPVAQEIVDAFVAETKEREGQTAKRSTRDRTEEEQPRDEAYMRAVKAGDMNAAQRMVDEAAKKAMPNTKIVGDDGFPLVVYQGTNQTKDFFIFDEHGESGGSGIYFTSDRNFASMFGRRVLSVFLNAQRGLPKGEAFKKYEGTGGNPRRITIEKMIADGYDHWYTDDYKEIAVFFPEQIKSADPVTYDDAGNVIPLSERFNAEETDIRYSQRDASLEEARKNTANARSRVKRTFSTLQETIALARAESPTAVLDPKQVKETALRLANGDKTTALEIAAAYRRMHERMRSGEPYTWDEFREDAKKAADTIAEDAYSAMESAEYGPMTQNGQFSEAVTQLRNSHVSFSPEDKKELRAAFGKDWVRYVFGKIKVDKYVPGRSAQAKDVFADLMAVNPELAPADDTERDGQQAAVNLVHLLNEMSGNVWGSGSKSESRHTENSAMMQEITEQAYSDIWDGYMDIASTLLAPKSDKVKAAAEKLRADVDAYRDAMRRVTTEALLEQGDRLREKYTERMKTRIAEIREGQKVRHYTERIRNTTQEMTEWFTHPDLKRRKLVPDFVKEPVARFLEALDFTTKSREELKRGGVTKQDFEIAERIKAVMKSLDNYRANVSDYVADFSPEVTEQINDIIETLENAANVAQSGESNLAIHRMESEKLKSLYYVLRAVKAMVQKMGMLIAGDTFRPAAEAAESTAAYLDGLTGPMKNYEQSEPVKEILWRGVKPWTIFDRFGEGGRTIFRELTDAQGKLAMLAKQLREFTEKAYTDEQAKRFRETNITVQLGDPNDPATKANTVTMSVADAMTLYLTMQDPDGRRHLLSENGGFRRHTTGKGRKADVDTGHTVTAQDVENILREMDKAAPDARAVAQALHTYAINTVAEWKNEIDLKRFGVYTAINPLYMSLFTDYMQSVSPQAEQRASTEEIPSAASMYALLNASFHKARKDDADNRIIIYDIFEWFAKYAGSMAQYNAFALPILDTIKWLNWKDKDAGISVRDSMMEAYGMGEEHLAGGPNSSMGVAERAVYNVINALNGTEARGDSNESMFIRMLKRYNASRVIYNMRVMAQQPLSAIRAAYVLGFKDLAKGYKFKSPDEFAQVRQEMYDNEGIAVWKQLGFFDVNISRGLSSIIMRDSTMLDKYQEFGMLGAEKADEATWVCLYNACKKRAAETGEDVHDLFSDVIFKTQVVDSALTRSEWMRSPSYTMKAMTSFMGEPTTEASVMINALDRLSQARRSGDESMRRDAIRSIGTAAATYSIGAVLQAAVESLFDAMDDDDDDEKFYQKYAKKFFVNVMQDLNPFMKIPIVKEFAEGLEYILSSYTPLKKALAGIGYEPYTELPEGGVFNDIIEPIATALGIIAKREEQKTDGYTEWAVIRKFLQFASEISGTGADVLVKQVIRPWNAAMDIIGRPQYKVKTYISSGERSANLMAAMESGDRKQFDALIEKHYGTMTDDAKTAVRTAIRNSYYDAEIGMAEAKKYLKTYLGMDEKAAESAVKSWDKNLAKKEQEEG